MATLAEFLAARLDEDEANVANAEEEGRFGDAPWTVARDRRELTAKRQILDQLASDLSYKPPVPAGRRRAWAIASLVAETLASVWSDHPDYDQGWAR